MLLIVFSVCLVYGWHLHKVRATRQQARLELQSVLQAGKPDVTILLNAFDRSTEDVVFAAAGPYFMVAVAVIFLVNQILRIRRRISVLEHLVNNRAIWSSEL